MNKGLLLGILALGGGAAILASGKAAKAKTAGMPTTGPTAVGPGDKYQLVFVTSRPITPQDLGAIQSALTTGMSQYADIEGVSNDGSSTSVIVNAGFHAPTTLQVGMVAAAGDIIMQLVSYQKVM